jgi:hypothetical protein
MKKSLPSFATAGFIFGAQEVLRPQLDATLTEFEGWNRRSNA